MFTAINKWTFLATSFHRNSETPIDCSYSLAKSQETRLRAADPAYFHGQHGRLASARSSNMNPDNVRYHGIFFYFGAAVGVVCDQGHMAAHLNAGPKRTPGNAVLRLRIGSIVLKGVEATFLLRVSSAARATKGGLVYHSQETA